jgi:hypothetical protein
MIEVKIHAKDSPEYREACTFQGELFGQWLAHWYSLASNERDIYSHPYYVMSWLSAGYSITADDTRLFTLYDKGTFIGVFPFVLKRNPIPGMRSFYLHSPIIELGSSPAMKFELFVTAMKAIFETPLDGFGKPLALQFHRVDETHRIVHDFLGQVVTRTGYTRNLVDIPVRYMEELRGHSKCPYYKNLRRKYRKAEQLGSLSLSVTTDREKLAKSFDDYADLEMSGWKQHEKRAMRNNRFIYDFYRSVLLGFGNLGKAVSFKLLLGNKVIGHSLEIMDAGTLYSMKTSFCQEYRDLSPGVLLFDKTVTEFCPEHTIRYYNTMSSSPWFRDLIKPHQIETYRISFFPETIAGAIMKRFYMAKDRFRKV